MTVDSAFSNVLEAFVRQSLLEGLANRALLTF